MFRRLTDIVVTGTVAAVMLTGCSKTEKPSDDPGPVDSPSGSEATGTNVDRPLSVNHEPSPSPVPSSTPRAKQTVSDPAPSQSRVYRASDNRPEHNPARLAGIKRYESRRLVLYTDINPQIARGLPPLADQLFDELERVLGKLPSNREETPFQVTGYLMGDRDRFRAAGLLGDRVPQFGHGRHVGYEFWMNDQAENYYRRHLMLHEFVHCFMTCVTGMQNTPPVWYMEGMAEYFATHRLRGNEVSFGVMPENKNDYRGLGRIGLIERAVSDARGVSALEIFEQSQLTFDNTSAYAWSWSMCWFLANHPLTKDGFLKINPHQAATAFAVSMKDLFGDSREALNVDWNVFAAGLCDGLEMPAAATRHAPASVLRVGEHRVVEVSADRAWQVGELLVEADQAYTISTSGQVQVNNEPEPWVSEPQGVSLRYVRGLPLGCVVGAVYDATDEHSLSRQFRIGRGREWTPTRTGTLALRINDMLNSLSNNSGTLAVRIERLR